MSNAPLNDFDEFDDFNVYAPPKTAIGQTGGTADFWREGELLVMSIGAVLPDRCIKCNAPAHGVRWDKRLSWHPPLIALLVLINLLLYLIVAVIFTKRAQVSIGVCRKHLTRRRRLLATTWLLLLVSIAVFIGGVGLSFDRNTETAGIAVMILAGAALVTGLVIGLGFAPLVTPTEITKTHVRLKRVHPGYLAMLDTVEAARARS